MYHVFVATAIGLVLLNRVWQLFKNFGVIAGVEAAERYIQPGVIIYTAPMAFATGSPSPHPTSSNPGAGCLAVSSFYWS